MKRGQIKQIQLIMLFSSHLSAKALNGIIKPAKTREYISTIHNCWVPEGSNSLTNSGKAIINIVISIVTTNKLTANTTSAVHLF